MSRDASTRNSTALLLFLSMPVVATAQGADIVVTGRRPPDDKVVRAMVRQMAQPIDGKLARWQTPVCPTASGLSDTSNAALVARMRRVAEAGNIKLGAAGCAPNLFLVFAPDGRTFFKEVSRHATSAFIEMKRAQREALLVGPGPARVWVTSVLHSEDGIRAQPDEKYNGAATIKLRHDTNIPMQSQQNIERVFVVIDSAAAVGKSLHQLADYAAMRGLAHLSPPVGIYRADSITALFDAEKADVPPTLTTFDLAFLKTLYRGAANMPLSSKLADLTRQVTLAGGQQSASARPTREGER